MKKLIVDPLSGWLYGFPKEYPRNLITNKSFDKWLVDNGYPQKLINEGMSKYCRWWEEEDVK